MMLAGLDLATVNLNDIQRLANEELERKLLEERRHAAWSLVRSLPDIEFGRLVQSESFRRNKLISDWSRREYRVSK